MVDIISSEFRKKIETEIGEYLLKELEKYPAASKKIHRPVIRTRGEIPTIAPQLIPILETIIIIIQSVFLMAHGRLIIEHWRHVKEMNDINLALRIAAKKSEENVKMINKISYEMNNLNNKLNNFGLPNDAKDDIFVVLIKKIANILADYDILLKDQKERR